MNASEYFESQKARVHNAYTSGAMTTGIIVTILILLLTAIRCIMASVYGA